MVKRTYTDRSNSRYVDLQGLREYLQIGRDNALKIGKESGALVKIGKCTRYDLQTIDNYMQTLRGGANE